MLKPSSNRRLWGAGVAALVVLVCASIFLTKGKVIGDVFIVTRSSESLKLGLVQVQVFDEDSFHDHIGKLQEQVKSKQAPEVQQLWKKSAEVSAEKARLKGQSSDAAIAAVRKDRDDFIEAFTMAEEETYFRDLPPPLMSTKTDANGVFTFAVPRTGRFVVVAVASRDIGKQTEKYYWAVKVSMGLKFTRRISLNNDNLVSADSPESAIKLILPALMK